MSTDDLVRSWKDPDNRPAAAQEHPAGNINIDAVGAYVQNTTTTTIVVGTEIMSCFPSCDSTVWDGSCNVASVGCC